MDRKNLNKANRLNNLLEVYTGLVEQLKQPVAVVLQTLPTETAGSMPILTIFAADEDLKPAIKNKKAAFINDLITYYTNRITDIEAEILTL